MPKKSMYKLKYVGVEERIVHLPKRKFKVKKGDTFEVDKDVFKSFEGKELFQQVK